MSSSYTTHTNFGEPVPQGSIFRLRLKKRRLISRSDEEIYEEMDSKSLSYRQGWPDLLPLPLDTVSTGASRTVEDFVTHLEVVQEVFKDNNIVPKNVRFAFRLPRGLSNGSDKEPYLTCLILVDFEKPMTKLKEAILRTRKYFRDTPSQTVNSLLIEVLDWRAIDNLKSHAILPSDDAVHRSFEEVYERVQEVLEQDKYNEPWITLELLRRGLWDDRTRCRPTLVITSPTAAAPRWWNTVLPALKSVVNKVIPGLDIELLQGISVIAHDSLNPVVVPLNQYRYNNTVMGVSIGLDSDPSRAGTCGGQIILHKDGKNFACGLTNWHVVRDERMDRYASKEEKRIIQAQPLYPAFYELTIHPQIIVAPSHMDHKVRLSSTEKDLRIIGSMRGEHALPSLYQAIQDRGIIKTFYRAFGTVFAGSGRRSTTEYKYNHPPQTLEASQGDKTYTYPLDWALIKLRGGRQIKNVIHETPLTGLRNDEIEKYNITTELETGSEANRWTRFFIRGNDVDVVKHGRTSLWTQGKINPIPICICPENDPEISKVYRFTDKKYGTCWGIVNKNVGRENVFKGDSGSIAIHDGSGAWLGLIFGVSQGGEGLMIPMDLIMKDIERVTGAEVIEPKYTNPRDCGLLEPPW